MTWRIALAVWLMGALSLFALNAPRAQFNGCTAGFCSPVTTSAAYVGPGDVISGASMWFGLRGYSAAYAAPGTNPAIKIIRASDSTNTTINILSNGNLDTTTAATFCNSTTCTVATWYDQTGHSCDATQATVANQPVLTFNAIGSFPALTGAGNLGTVFADILTTACTYTQALPVTLVAYAVRNGNTTTTSRLIGKTGANYLLGYQNVANEPTLVGNTSSDFILASVNDGTWQTLFGSLNVNNSASTLYNNANATNATFTDSVSFAAVMTLFGRNTGAQGFNGNTTEMGAWPIMFSQANATAMDANIRNYY
jgi:hypothetical protein